MHRMFPPPQCKLLAKAFTKPSCIQCFLLHAIYSARFYRFLCMHLKAQYNKINENYCPISILRIIVEIASLNVIDTLESLASYGKVYSE